MQRIALAWAALSLSILASPSPAQQAGGTAEAQLETRYLQSIAPAPPPPRAHYVAPKPPPFPPMPRTEPKKRSAKAVTVHRSNPKRHGTVKASTSKGRHMASKRHQARSVATRPAKVHLSPRTIRQCHGMGYKQIMAHRDCRALMQQEISAADQSHHAAKRHKTAAKGKAIAKSKAKRQTTKKHGRR